MLSSHTRRLLTSQAQGWERWKPKSRLLPGEGHETDCWLSGTEAGRVVVHQTSLVLQHFA